MGNKTEIRSRIRIAERSNGRSQLHHSCNGFAGCFREHAVCQHLVLPVFHDAHVDMQSRTCFSCRYFRSKSKIKSILISKVTDYPFGNHQLIGSLISAHRQKFYFVLLVYLAIKGEIAHFGMPVLDLPAGLCNVCHTFGAELIEFGIRSRFVIGSLIGGGEHTAVFRNNIIFQFAHSLKLHAGHLRKRPARLAQSVVRRAFQRFAVFIEERAKHGERRLFGKRILKSRTETGNYV